ncbi:MAG TPA: polysaccharide biosynthesis tyrosine autokinase [Opitutales bacterium]|nr:polysaccharide biosynthesis tyrosine autokinase [Opitutales bacterium]
MNDLFNDEDQSGKIDYTEILHKALYRAKIVLKRFWWVVPVAVSMGVAYKAVETFLQAPVYRSDAQMMLSGRISLPENELYAEERGNFFGTQIELMESDQVKSRAVERVKLAQPEVYKDLEQSEDFLNRGLRSLDVVAEVKDDTSIFTLKALTPTREFSRAFLDAVMAEYINRRSEMRAKTSEKTYDAIAAKIRSLETEIDENEDAIVEFQKKNNIVFIQEQGSAAGTYLADLKRRLAELKTEARTLSSISDSSQVEDLMLKSIQPPGDASSDGTFVSAVGSQEDNEKYVLAKNQLEQLKADLEEFEIYLKPKHPKIIGLKNQIERTSNQLEILRRQAFERIGERKLVIERRIENLNDEIQIWEQSALENSRLIAEFERLQSRLERSKAAYERNQEALRAIDTGQSLSQETVSVLEDASPAYPAGQGTIMGLAEGAVYGMVLAVGVLVLISFLDNRIFSAADITNHFDEPLLGAIPFEKNHNGDQSTVLLRKSDDRYIFAEACRNLRTSVFFMGDESWKPSVFAVTSAIPSEGKSTVSANLAVALSFSHSKVLLVDADLRRGRLHKLFNLNFENGLTGLLEGRRDLDEVVQRSSYDNLDFISIGGHPDHPAELLMSDKMGDLIKLARQRYDFIVFDTAPILATDDTTSFAPLVDAVLFTVRCSFTHLRQIKPAVARLKERSTNVDGIILNYVDTAQPGYYYYRYSEYYTSPQRSQDTVGSPASA